MESSVAESVYRGLVDKIVSGAYPQGSLLPSCRQLSNELGVNKNTVNKAFRALSRDGVVDAIPGVGMLVVKRPDAKHVSSEIELTAAMDRLLYQARTAGVSLRTVDRVYKRSVSRWYTSLKLSALLVECNMQDAGTLAAYIEKNLSMVITPCLIDDFLKDPTRYSRQYDMIITTFYHLAEIYPQVPQRYAARVVAVSDRPSHSSLLALSRVPQVSKLGLVAGHLRTIEQMKVTLESCGRTASEWAVIDDTDSVARLLRSVDLVVSSVRCVDRVKGMDPNIAVETITFEVDQQSVEFLRKSAGSLIDRKVGSTPDQEP